MSETTTFLQAVPVLPALNLDQTVEFYQQKMGFSLSNRYEGYAILQRENLHLHFSNYAGAFTPATNPFTCYIYVKNIVPLYEEYMLQGVIHPNGKLETKPWGMRQFSVLDIDGTLLTFGESATDGDSATTD